MGTVLSRTSREQNLREIRLSTCHVQMRSARIREFHRFTRNRLDDAGLHFAGSKLRLIGLYALYKLKVDTHELKFGEMWKTKRIRRKLSS